jgi:hypothetical protein
MILRSVVIVAMVAAAGSAQAASQKETDCGHQASVVAAIQQARIDRVSERKVAAHVTAAATWPENYNHAIPFMAGWVYGDLVSRKELHNQDLSAVWNELCLQK